MKIFDSFRARVFVLTTLLVLMTALSIAIFQQIQIERPLVDNELKNARNMLNLAATQIETRYESLLLSHSSLIKERKRNLKTIVEIAMVNIETLYQKSLKNEMTDPEARKAAAEYSSKLRYDDGIGYIWINTSDDPVPIIISHPTMPEIEGKLPDSITGKIFKAFVDACKETGEGYVDYLWPKPTSKGVSEKQPKLSFVKSFKPWNWIIGTGLYMDDIEKSRQARIDTITRELRNIFSKVKISENSYLFMFDSNLKMLVHPNYEGKGPDEFNNPEREIKIIEQFKEIAATPEKTMTYQWQKPGDPRKNFFYEKQACVYHFAPLGWYVVASVYKDELTQPLIELRWKILIITSILLSLSLLLTSILANSLSQPLQKLAAIACSIKTEGIRTTVEIPQSGIKEIVKLGQCLSSMLNSIKYAIDDRDRLFQQIQSEEEKHRATLHSIADAVISTDIDGHICGMNPAAETLTGWALDEATGRDISEVYQTNPGATLTRCKSAIKKAAPETRHFKTSNDVVMLAKNGVQHHISEQASLICSDNGDLKGMVLVFHNITEDYLIQQQLKEVEWKFYALFEHGPLGVAYHRMIYDESGKPVDYYFIDANSNYRKLTGIDPRGKNVKEAFPGIENDPFDWIGNFGRVARTGKQFRFRQHLPLNNRWYEGVAFQYKPDHFVAAFFEITEQRKLEQQLQQAQKMDAVGQLAGGIAHDFNNVLGGIIGAAELLNMDLSENPKQKKFLNIIIESSQRAADLIRKLLAFSRLKPLNTTPVDTHTTVRDAAALLECSIDKRVKIDLHLDAEKYVVNGDMSQLQTVFINLGINASHAMPDGGHLTISSSTMQLDEITARAHEVEPGHYIQFQVRDSGIGINHEHLSRLFEPFFTTKATGKGTGLGLAVSFGIIKQHLGAITVYSEPGAGTVFHILLPLSNLEYETEIDLAKPVQGHGRILVIDDEKIIRETAGEILKSLGYEVISADSASAGIKIFAAGYAQIDLVLLDMIMPEINGRECFAKLKEINPLVKVVLASGFSKEEDLDKMMETGLCGFIQKPYSRTALSQILNKVIS